LLFYTLSLQLPAEAGAPGAFRGVLEELLKHNHFVLPFREGVMKPKHKNQCTITTVQRFSTQQEPA
jgi:hypothetical protein